MEVILLPDPNLGYFEVLPQHKKRISTLAWSLYKIRITEEEIDEMQRREPFVNFNYHQAEFLRRSLVLQKICFPILWSQKLGIEEAVRNRFGFSFMNTHLAQAQACFVHGLSLPTIFLCRSSLEIGLREAIAHVRASKSKTTFLKEYSKRERKMIRKLIREAQEIGLTNEKEIDDIFTFQSKTEVDFKPRKLLNKFIHGGYSDLFVLVQNITIEGSKSKDFEDFIERMYEMDKGMKMGKSFSRSTYVRMVLSEELALFFLQALFRIAKLIFLERLEACMHQKEKMKE